MRDPETSQPAKPEPSPNDTLRLTAGMPEDPHRTQPLPRGEYLRADSTVKLPLAELVPGSDQTQKLALPRLDPPPLAPRIEPIPESAGQTQKLALRPGPSKAFGWKLPLALGALAVLGGAAYLWFGRARAPLPPPFLVEATAPESVPKPESVPREVQVYLDQAKAGDARAMRMLGAMYYNGLNVPRDREKGLSWYRMAAEKGSDAARKELGNLEGGR
jgi:hypothetical protein